MTARAHGLSAAAVLLVLLPGCTSFADGVAADRAAAPSAGQPDPEQACPDERAEPDPDRPRIALDLRLHDDRRTVTGTEAVTFTPDRPTDELVFRLVPNQHGSSREVLVHEVAHVVLRDGRHLAVP
ncbi:hypothetical protein [Blastococcus capsensis]|uniref:hypothetical protein n=1 Tax=Blastococcus capsensis TaxID=1564163 RepID=UPI0025424C9A|nr:hypothetical protein [Blastococcus capsensis]MDK3256324.1 hypothetical protein [Blastococcus capsensis]